eukprot:TRINITY_DN5534_c0_g1_i1.p1 TRINITY_DN5534_c0_g1~~TRINITY_DN5534_c0_g1_i1.p1  ORF type:complete len:172 (+),score=23.72 TRINITY_DN5534_c0_g1_i1:35-517(+)
MSQRPLMLASLGFLIWSLVTLGLFAASRNSYHVGDCYEGPGFIKGPISVSLSSSASGVSITASVFSCLLAGLSVFTLFKPKRELYLFYFVMVGLTVIMSLAAVVLVSHDLVKYDPYLYPGCFVQSTPNLWTGALFFLIFMFIFPILIALSMRSHYQETSI